MQEGGQIIEMASRAKRRGLNQNQREKYKNKKGNYSNGDMIVVDSSSVLIA